MAQTTNRCQDCVYIQGNECYQYLGDTMDDCGLISGQWYKIEDLIQALQCAGFSTTTSSTTTSSDGGDGSCNSCICLLVEGYNNIYGEIGNGTASFNYRLYKDENKTDLLLERSLSAGVNNTYTKFGPLDFQGPIYPAVTIQIQTSASEFNSFGDELDAIITVNEMIVYARSIAIPAAGENIFPDLPSLGTGRIKLFLYNNRLDTNTDEGQGIVAVGGNKLSNSSFIINTSLNGGGKVGIPEMSWPDALTPSSDFVYTNFDTEYYGQYATNMKISVAGTNAEGTTLMIQYIFSKDSSIGFEDTILDGQSYQKTLNLTIQQAVDNDILIKILTI